MPREGFVSVFFGLGPRGDITEQALRERIDEVCPVRDFRMRERFAFVDCAQADAENLVHRLNGMRFNSSTLTCQISKRDDPARPRRGDDRRGGRDDRRPRRDDSRDRRRRDDSRDRRPRRDDSRDRRRRDDSRDRRPRRDDSRDRRRRDDSRDRRPRRDDRDRRRRDDSRERRRDDSRERRRDDSRDKRHRREDRDAPRATTPLEDDEAENTANNGANEENYATNASIDVTASYQQEEEHQQPHHEGAEGQHHDAHNGNNDEEVRNTPPRSRSDSPAKSDEVANE